MSGTYRSCDFLHLVRLEAEGLRGWQLRFPPWHPLGPQTRYFADTVYGSADAAYTAARAQRDLEFSRAGLPLRQRGNIRHARNTSGLVGVMLQFSSRRKGVSAFTWTALWSENLKARRKAFSVARLGFEGALDAAIAWRYAKTGLGFTAQQREQALLLRARVVEHVRQTRENRFFA